MADVRPRRQLPGVANDTSDSSEAGAASRTSAESQVVARTILERGQRGHGVHLDQLAEMALDGAPVASAGERLAVNGPGPPSAPPAEEFLRLFNEYERYVASIGS